MSDLPQLPRPDRNAWPHGWHDLFNADQMRQYATEAIAADRAKREPVQQARVPDFWAVVEPSGFVNYTAQYPEACHEHINDAINDAEASDFEINEAVQWKVRPAYFDASPREQARVPDGMLERVIAAHARIINGHAPRRIPADPTDVDLVLMEVAMWIEGKAQPFWIAAAPMPPRVIGSISDAKAHNRPIYSPTFAAPVEPMPGEQDAARYRKLRGNHWSDGPDTLVITRARDVKLGCRTFSGESGLDEAIDAQPEETT